MRIDVFLVEKGHCSSRNKAKDLLLKAGVKVNGVIISKPSHLIFEKDIVTVDNAALLPYVSKGGLKLKKAIDVFNLDLKGKYILDIGASTGGFTDCAIKHGAEFVWAVDVGTTQLVADLKVNIRVRSIENTDIRSLKIDTIGRLVDVVVADLSFISLKLIVKHIPQFLSDSGFAILLIKPQFEVGVNNIDKGGIVNNQRAHVAAINGILVEAKNCRLFLSNLTSIPIIDNKKNIEYLAMFETHEKTHIDINEVVSKAFIEKKSFKAK